MKIAFVKMLEVLPLLLLSIVLPTVDVITDIILMAKLYSGIYDCSCPDCYQNCVLKTYEAYATAMLIPFVSNYIVCVCNWSRLGQNRKKTWIFALINCYPQYGKKIY